MKFGMYNRVIDTIKIKIFRPGKTIVIQGRSCTVDHVHVRNHVLLVHFKELEQSINADDIQCEYDELDCNREI